MCSRYCVTSSRGWRDEDVSLILMTMEHHDYESHTSDVLIHNSGDEGVNVKNRKGLTVEPNLVLYVLAHAATHHVLEQLLYTIVSEQHGVQSIVRLDQDKIPCSSDVNDKYTKMRTLIQQDVSYWLSYMRIAVCVPSIITAFVWGNISDKFSRKWPILLPLLANVSLIVIVLCVISFKLPTFLLLAGYLFEGLGGSTSTFFMGCYAYLGQVSTKENRTSRINKNEICIILSSSASSFVIGYLLKSLGFVMPLLLILSIYTVNILYTLCLLPEIAPEPDLSAGKTIQCSGLLSLYTKKRHRNGRAMICCWASVYFFYVLPGIGRNSASVLFLQNEPFCWNAKNIGLYFSIGALALAFWNICVLYFLQRPLGDMGLLVIAQLASVISMVMTAFSKSSSSLFAALFMFMPHGIAFTVMRSTLSKLVPSNEQGAVFSSIAFTELTVALFATLIFNMIYANSVAVFSGLIFIISAGFYAFSLLLTWYIIYMKNAGNQT